MPVLTVSEDGEASSPFVIEYRGEFIGFKVATEHFQSLGREVPTLDERNEGLSDAHLNLRGVAKKAWNVEVARTRGQALRIDVGTADPAGAV